MKHLNEAEAALLAGGDLPFWTAPALHTHARLCGACRATVEEYRQQREELREQAENFRLPKGFDWPELEAEMAGNIRLGAEVARITPPPRRLQEEWMDWRGVVAICALTTVVITGWYLTGPAARHYPRIPGWSQARVENGDLELSANPSELGLKRQGSGFYFRSATPTATRVEVGLEGSLRSASFDQDSGQLTVTQVSLAQDEPLLYEE
jgi:hypothetical protein